MFNVKDQRILYQILKKVKREPNAEEVFTL